MSKPTVEARGLRKAFGEVQALDGLRLEVTAGSVAWSVGLLVVFALLAVRIYARMGR